MVRRFGYPRLVDDTWLNEAFATWTSSKIIAEWKPEWHTRLSDLGSKYGAIGQDSLVTTRQIRQPIETNDDISNAFDGITYQKGAAVIRMFEVWTGEKQFQKGVSGYLKQYAYKNARMNDFLDALSNTGQPRLTRAFTTFLEQPGIPEISVALKCDGPPRVALTQKRYLPIGSSGSKDKIWQTPVCVRYNTPQGPQHECFLLDKASDEFKLSKTTSCPATLWANEAASGYYIAAYDRPLLESFSNNHDFLNAAERQTLLNDVAVPRRIRESQAEPGARYSAELCRCARAAKSSEHRKGLWHVPKSWCRRFCVRTTRVSSGRRLEHAPRILAGPRKPGEDDERRLLRLVIVPFVAVSGEDPELQKEARHLADGWLQDRKGVDPDMLGSVLAVSAWHGDRAFFDTLLAELKKTEDRRQRNQIINAIGSFQDPKLVELRMI